MITNLKDNWPFISFNPVFLFDGLPGIVGSVDIKKKTTKKLSRTSSESDRSGHEYEYKHSVLYSNRGFGETKGL